MLPVASPGISDYISQINARRQAAGQPPLQMPNSMLASGAVPAPQAYQKPVNYDPRSPGGSFGAPGTPSPTIYSPTPQPFGDTGRGGVPERVTLPPPSPAPQQAPQSMPGYNPLSKLPAAGIRPMAPIQSQYRPPTAGIRVPAVQSTPRPAAPTQAPPLRPFGNDYLPGNPQQTTTTGTGMGTVVRGPDGRPLLAAGGAPRPQSPGRTGGPLLKPTTGVYNPTAGDIAKYREKLGLPAQASPTATARAVMRLRNKYGTTMPGQGAALPTPASQYAGAVRGIPGVTATPRLSSPINVELRNAKRG